MLKPKFVVVFFSYAVLHCTLRQAIAAPTASPSAQAAANLAHHPPSGWISHYLPADRYKVKGGVWKFVSTELDTFYHRPDSPLMLLQSADIVIGFASASDAEEAGYRPGPSITEHDRRTGHIGGMQNSMDNRPQENIPTSGIVRIPSSQISKPILAFIRLVDFSANQIQSTSSRSQLLTISLALDRVQSDFSKGKTAPYLGNSPVSMLDGGSMNVILGQLSKAAELKSATDSPSPDVKATLANQLISQAKSAARDLIPQIKQIRAKQGKNLMQEQLRTMFGGRRGGGVSTTLRR